MSSAFYPLGMKSYNNHLPQGGYKTWKGSGVNKNPIGITAGNIRPLTNNDMGNVFPTGFGLPRPIKHYRKGTVIPVAPIIVEDPNNPEKFMEVSLINYNLNRLVKSSTGGALISQLIDNPNGVVTKQNTPVVVGLKSDCDTCQGIGVVTTYYPNKPYLTENPEVNTQIAKWCCNAERKALRRVLPASTLLKKNYYTTHTQYLENRCQTYQQRAFNFQSNSMTNNPAVKPGSPLALTNTYFANCYPNGEIYEATELALINKMLNIMLLEGALTPELINQIRNANIVTINELFNYLKNLIPEPYKTNAIVIFVDFVENPYYGVPLSGPSNPVGCKLVVYKPSNPQFAVQGSVSSSTRNLKLNVDTIQTNAASFNAGMNPVTPFILKNKVAECGNPPIIRYQNKKACYLSPSYNLYREPTQPPGSSNAYAQSPRNSLM